MHDAKGYAGEVFGAKRSETRRILREVRIAAVKRYRECVVTT